MRFTQGENFSGLLVGVLKASLDGGTKAGFMAMNTALKERAEGLARTDAVSQAKPAA